MFVIHIQCVVFQQSFSGSRYVVVLPLYLLFLSYEKNMENILLQKLARCILFAPEIDVALDFHNEVR